jgi:DNA-binding transcriptional LysR family regulator
MSQRNENLTGRLRVTAPISFGTNFLGSVIAEFARHYPELEIAVDYEDRCVNLSQGGYDVGIRMGDLKESSLKARKLCDCARIVCCSFDYATNYGLPESVAELARHTCIDYAHARTTDVWQFDTEPGGETPPSVMMRSRIIANNFEAMRDMAIAGLGLVLLPRIPGCRTSSRRQADLGTASRDPTALYDFGCLSLYAPRLIQGATLH